MAKKFRFSWAEIDQILVPFRPEGGPEITIGGKHLNGEAHWYLAIINRTSTTIRWCDGFNTSISTKDDFRHFALEVICVDGLGT